LALGHSPRIVMDGLVLCLDGANYKSFKGEATTNILTNGNFSSGLTGWSDYAGTTRTVQTVTNIPIYQNTSKTVLNCISRSTIGSGNYGGIYQGVSMTAGVTYTISYYARSLSGSMTLKFSFQSGAGDENNMSHSNTLTSEWTKFTYTATLNVARGVMYVWNQNVVSGIFELTDVQIEAKSYATTFTTGTRGTTVATGGGWKDLIGSNNGELVNAVRESADDGGSLVFDGTNDYVSVGNLGSFPTQGTISYWMNSSAVENYRNPFTTKYNGLNACIRFEQYTAVGFKVVIGNDSGTYSHYDYSSTTVLTENVWYNVVFIWNTSTNNAVGYLNGVEKFDTSHSLWPTTLPSVAIGQGFNSSRFFAGKISNVQIYNRSLSAAEVKQNFDAHKGRYGL
jgi:hypothetical protein